MPEAKQPPTIQEADLQQIDFILEQKIASQEALALVNQTFFEFQNFRSQNHDTRWQEHDQLYAGWLPERKWPGTQIKRSNIPYPIVFDQVEAALPAIMSALFNNGGEWFSVTAEPGGDPKQAQEIQDSLSYDFEHNGDYGCTIRAELALAIRQLLLHGNGGLCVQWDPENDRPAGRWVDLRNMYFDPGADTPSTDKNRAVVERMRLTSAQIIEMGAQDSRFKVPTDEELWAMVQSSNVTDGDATISAADAVRGIRYFPGSTDWVPSPADSKVEVLIYTSKSRIIWVINRQWVLYNGNNPYGCINYCFGPCYPYPGRFYAQSIGDIQAGLQRAIEGYMNAHRDEVALRIHPPRVSSRSSNLTPQERKYGPGTDMIVDDAQKDVQIIQQQGGLMNIFPDVQFLLSQADTRTGLNGLMNSVPRPSNANRTASGMQMQMSGSMNRLSTIVQNIEDYIVVPMLYLAYKLKQFHMNPDQTTPAMKRDTGESYEVSGASYSAGNVKFRVQASSKMISRERLLQTIPVIAQYILAPAMVAEGAKVGKTVDFEQVMDMLMEATGIQNKWAIWRQMTPQEQQAMQQNSPQAVEQARTQAESQTKMGIAQLDSQTKLQVEGMKHQPNPGDQAIIQMEMEQKKQEMAMDSQDRQAEQMMKVIEHQMEMGFRKQEMEMDAGQKQQEMQMKQAEGQQDVQMGQMKHQFDMEQMIQKAMAQKEAAKIAPAPKGAGSTGRPAAASAPRKPKTKKTEK